MDKIRTAVIGVGKMGRIHAKVYSQLPKSQLTALVDMKKEKAQALAGRYGCESFDNCSELIGKVDAVTIATPGLRVTRAHPSAARQSSRVAPSCSIC